MKISPKLKKRVAVSGLVVGGLALLLVLLVIAGYALLQSHFGQQRLAGLISSLASSPDLQIKLEGLSGRVPWSMHLDQITLSDRDGVWLTAENLDTEWKIGPITDGQINLPRIHLQKATLTRFPKSADQPPSPKPASEQDIKTVLDNLKLPNLVVGELVIEEVVAAPPLSDPPIRFSVKGRQILDGRSAQIALTVERLDESPDHLDLNVDLAGDPSILTIKMDLAEESAGIIRRVIGLPQAEKIKVALSGTGPVTDWKGAFSFMVQDTITAEADLYLGLADPLKFGLVGEAELDPGVLSDKAAQWTGRKLAVDLAASLAQNRYLTLDHLDVSNIKTALNIQGRADLADETFDTQFELNAKDLTQVRDLSGMSIADSRILKGTASGPFSDPKVNIATDLGKLAYDVYSIENASVSLDFSPSAPLESADRELKAKGRMRLSGITTPFGDLVPDQMDVAFDIGTKDMKSLNLHELAFDGGYVRASVSGDLNLATLETVSKSRIQVVDLSRFSATGADLSGAITIDSNVVGVIPNDLRLDFLGHLQDVKGLPDQVVTLMGPAIDFSGSVAYTPEAVNLSDVFIQGNSQVSLAGRMDLVEKAVDMDYRVDLGGLPNLMSQYGVRTGPAEAKGRISGPLSAMTLDLGLALGKVTANGQTYSGINLSAKMTGLPADIKGSVRLKGNAAGLDLDAKTYLALKNNNLSLQKLSVEAPGTTLKGDLSFHLPSGLINGDAQLDVVNLNSLSRFTGQTMVGRVNLKISAKATKGKQSLTANGSIKGLKYGEIGAETIAVRGTIDDLKRALTTAKMRVAARKLNTGGLVLKSIDAAVNSDDQGGRFQVRAAGSSTQTFSFDTTGSFTSGKKQPIETLTISALEAKYDRYPLKLVKPVVLTVTPDGFKVDGLDMTLQRGRVQGSGHMDSQSVALDLNLKEMPLSPLNMVSPISITGSIDGNINISGSPSNPALKTKVKVSGNVIPSQGFESSPPLDINLDASIAQGQMQADVQLIGLGDEPGRIKAGLPANFSLKPFAFNIPPSGQVSAKLDMVVDLGRLPAFLALDGQTIMGEARLDFTAQGPMSAIVASGQASISNTYYENIRLGVILKDIAADLKANGTKIQLTQLRMTDGVNGRITAQGNVNLDARQNFPFNMNMNIDEMELVRLAIFTTTATGKVNLSGNTQEASLKSDITFDPTEVKIPKQIPTQVADVTVRQLNTQDRQPKKKEKSQSPPTNLNLDVGLHFPARFFVRGDGINTEWKGNLQVTGTAAEPKISGGLDALRGHYELLGKRFALTQGSLSFTNSNPPSPLFTIIGQHKANDIIAIIKVSGSPGSPKLEISSEPALPQDEILARVLFGKKLSNISPMQAIKLAQAANDLSGGNKPSLDLLGKTRDALGLDQLEIKQGESGSTAIGAGKYISDDVYVEAEGGMKPEDQKVSVQIELSPSISLESEVGADSEGAFGIYWKKDY